jgi:hypothetical protein
MGVGLYLWHIATACSWSTNSAGWQRLFAHRTLQQPTIFKTHKHTTNQTHKNKQQQQSYTALNAVAVTRLFARAVLRVAAWRRCRPHLIRRTLWRLTVAHLSIAITMMMMMMMMMQVVTVPLRDHKHRRRDDTFGRRRRAHRADTRSDCCGSTLAHRTRQPSDI